MAGEAQQKAAEKNAKLIDAMSDDFADQLGEVINLLTVKIRAIAKQLETDAEGRIVSSQVNLALALKLRADLVDALNAAGFKELAQAAVDEPLDLLAAQVLKAGTVGGNAAALGGFDIDVLVSLKELGLAQLLNVGDDIAVKMWRTVVDGVLGTRPVVDLIADVADVLGVSQKQAHQIYDTAISVFSQQVALLNSTGEPDEAFFYVGPVDDRMRDFCEEHVGRVYSRTVIDGMDNGQMPNVLLSRGGYNCRHQWHRVSLLDEELLALTDTGEIAGGVKKRLDELRELEAA